AAAVDQDQRALRADAAERDVDRAVVAVVHLCVRAGVALFGQRLEELSDRDAAGGRDLVAAQHGDRGWSVEILAADAGASDDDLFGRRFSRGVGRRGLVGSGLGLIGGGLGRRVCLCLG